jgi:hypothetical protein
LPQSASRLAAALLNEGFRVAISMEPMEVGVEAWPRGSFVVRVSRNPDSLHERIDALAREAGVEVAAMNTAFPVSAQFSTGSETVISLTAPRIALVGGDGIFQTSYGAIWWTLEQRYRIPFSTLTLDALAGGDLSAYNVILVPDGSSRALESKLGRGAALRTWVSNGGTLVMMGGAANWAAGDSVSFTSARLLAADQEADKDAPTPPAVGAADPTIGVRSPTATSDAPEPVVGSFFDVVVDQTHWLTLGFDVPRTTVLFQRKLVLPPFPDRLQRGRLRPRRPTPSRRLHLAGHRAPSARHRVRDPRADGVRQRRALCQRAHVPRVVEVHGQARPERDPAGYGVSEMMKRAG